MLGPVDVTVGDAVRPVSGLRRKAVLAVLGLSAGRVVNVDHLVDVVWSGKPPRSADNTLQSHISHLRSVFGCRRAIVARPPGYLLALGDEATDVQQAEKLIRDGRNASDPVRVAAALRAALAVWRGQPLADVRGLPWLDQQAERLVMLHTEASHALVEARLALGEHALLVPELEEQTRQHPFDEQVHAQHMLALYRSGRQADALAAFQRLRQHLDEELGIRPGPAVRELQARILRQEPRLDPPLAPIEVHRSAPVPRELPPGVHAVTGRSAELAELAHLSAELVDLKQDKLAQREVLGRWIGHPAVAGAGAVSAAAQPSPVIVVAGQPPSAASGSVRPRQLPAPPRWFTGRVQELDRLDAILAAVSAGPGAVVAAVCGTAGVGKTALALHWAHRVADRFPDGQLYVNLRGFGPPGSTMTPAEAVRLLLASLDVAPQRVPAGIDARSSLLRSLLAGTRTLLLLDNAGSVDQVRPLLPATTGCMALLTSRTLLPGLIAVEGAEQVLLDRFSVAETRALLVDRLGPARVDAEPDAVEQVAARCAGLPLALAVVAARVVTRPRTPLNAVADELGVDLDVLNGGDAATDVRSVLSWSYLALSEPAARLFRLCALHPGQDLTVAAAASLAGAGMTTVRPALSELLDANLVDEHVPGRFAFHELLRMYALELVNTGHSAAERHTATVRMLDHYLHTGHAAALALHPHRHPIAVCPAATDSVITHITDAGQALAWFTAEHTNLLAVIGHAERTGFGEQTWQMAWTLTDFLDRHGHWHDQAAVQRLALHAAERVDDLTGQAHTRRGLARVCVQLDQPADAITHYRHALNLFARLGDPTSQAHTHLGLSWTLHRQSRTAEAITHDRKALQLFRALDHPLGQARSLNHLGTHLSTLGDHDAALAACRSALALFEQIGDRFGIAATSDSLGETNQRLGRHQDALVHYRRAVDLLRQTDDRYYTALAYTHLGDAHAEEGTTRDARSAWRQALDLLQQIDHPDAIQIQHKLAGQPTPTDHTSTAAQT
jgi:DNA-binding SARP family transcriptional activator/tetratricopeptide (TPR) repeat protein